MTSTNIYLAVRHDIHIDDEFFAFTDVGKAMWQCHIWRTCDNFQHMDFEQKERGYHFYADAGEDYSVRIEIIDLVE